MWHILSMSGQVRGTMLCELQGHKCLELISEYIPASCLKTAQKIVFFILNKSNFMHNIPFVPGGIDNLSRDSRSISRDVSVLYILYIGNI